jgi:hypothetical protein
VEKEIVSSLLVFYEKKSSFVTDKSCVLCVCALLFLKHDEMTRNETYNFIFHEGIKRKSKKRSFAGQGRL